MKKRMNVIFFSICFLASLLAEAYCIQILKGDIFTTIGIGIVVLINGYLFMDTIRSNLKLKSEHLQFYTDRILREETEKWSERYTELTNLQKATYAATKKNTAIFDEQIGDVITRLDLIESNCMKELQMMVELQKRSLEGQKNALNMQIRYNRENTKQIINALHGEEAKDESREQFSKESREQFSNDLSEQFSKILGLLETNNELLKTQIDRMENTTNNYSFNMDTEQKLEEIESDYNYEQAHAEDYNSTYKSENYYKEENNSDQTASEFYDNFREEDEAAATISYEEDDIAEVEESSIDDVIAEVEESSKAEVIAEVEGLSKDEVIAEVEETSKDEVIAEVEETSKDEVIAEVEETLKGEVIAEVEETWNEEASKDQDILELDGLYEVGDRSDVELPEAFEAEAPIVLEEDQISTDVEETKSSVVSDNVIVKPIYDDPNKALSADEIAALFASFGQ